MTRHMSKAIRSFVMYAIGLVSAVVLLAAALSLCGCSTANATGHEYRVDATVLSAEQDSYHTVTFVGKVPVTQTRYSYTTTFEVTDAEGLPSGEDTLKATGKDIFDACDGREGESVTVAINERGFVAGVEFSE